MMTTKKNQPKQQIKNNKEKGCNKPKKRKGKG